MAAARRQHEILSEIFRQNPSTPAKLLRKARKRLPKLGLKQVEDFLAQLPNYLETTKLPYSIYPKKLPLRHIYVGEANRHLFVDTWYLERSFNVNFVFVFVDGLTRFVWLRFAKKLNAESATKALASVLSSIPSNANQEKINSTGVLSVASDRGSEYKQDY